MENPKTAVLSAYPCAHMVPNYAENTVYIVDGPDIIGEGPSEPLAWEDALENNLIKSR